MRPNRNVGHHEEDEDDDLLDSSSDDDEEEERRKNKKRLKKRLPKKRKKRVTKSSSGEDGDKKKQAKPKQKKQKQRPKRRNIVQRGPHRQMTEVDHEEEDEVHNNVQDHDQNGVTLAAAAAVSKKQKEEDERIEALIAQDLWAFCCSTCACSEQAKEEAKSFRYIVSGDGRFPHRPCCHKLGRRNPPGEEWASRYEAAAASAAEIMMQQLENGGSGDNDDDDDDGDDDNNNNNNNHRDSDSDSDSDSDKKPAAIPSFTGATTTPTTTIKCEDDSETKPAAIPSSSTGATTTTKCKDDSDNETKPAAVPSAATAAIKCVDDDSETKPAAVPSGAAARTKGVDDDDDCDNETKPTAANSSSTTTNMNKKKKKKKKYHLHHDDYIVTVNHVKRLYDNTKAQQENEHANQSKAADPTLVLFTNQEYTATAKDFHDLAKQQQKQQQLLRGAVVLDLFSGMGTAMVALKRLGVAMETVIHCERDKVATFVYQEHHNSDIDTGTKYVYYPWFNNIYNWQDDQAYNDFMDAHAPIDLLLGGPPCQQDFTPINAAHQGRAGDKGSYMLKVAQLVRRMQYDRRQQGRPLYYLLENVVLSNDKDLPLSQGDKDKIKKALGCSWDPVELDAACISPTTGLRAFFTNICLTAWTETKAYKEDLECNPTSVLRDGFLLAANLYEPKMLAKVPTFMASKAQLNDDRMCVYRPCCADPMCIYRLRYKKEDKDNNINDKSSASSKATHYIERIITRSERLDLMGFPTSYLNCIDGLYETLLQNGHGMVCAPKHWKDALDERYYTFQGAVHGVSNPYDFYVMDSTDSAGGGVPHVGMRILPFLGSKPLNSQDYGKRLIGNAISVPVLEFCLKELTQVFASHQYKGYDYPYAWHRHRSS